jgi:hypothetical protein
VRQGNGGPSFTCALTRSRQASTVSIDFTASGTFNGFTPTSGTVTFPSGQTSKSIPFDWPCNNVDNDDRVVTITLSNPTSPLTVSPTNGAATLTVQDDDPVRVPGWAGRGVHAGRQGGRPLVLCIGRQRLARANPAPVYALAAPFHFRSTSACVFLLPHFPQPPDIYVATPGFPVVERNSGTTLAGFVVQLVPTSVSERPVYSSTRLGVLKLQGLRLQAELIAVWCVLSRWYHCLLVSSCCRRRCRCRSSPCGLATTGPRPKVSPCPTTPTARAAQSRHRRLRHGRWHRHGTRGLHRHPRNAHVQARR